MKHGRYILDGHTPVECEDLTTWSKWMEANDNRRVALTVSGGIRISTVFLGLDHGFMESGAPVVFETMVFRNDEGEECQRYRTWDEAEVGHQRWVAIVIEGRKQ